MCESLSGKYECRFHENPVWQECPSEDKPVRAFSSSHAYEVTIGNPGSRMMACDASVTDRCRLVMRAARFWVKASFSFQCSEEEFVGREFSVREKRESFIGEELYRVRQTAQIQTISSYANCCDVRLTRTLSAILPESRLTQQRARFVASFWIEVLEAKRLTA
jgi:hypothetical protein